jgi:2-dehydropantoate 2-reductase
VKVAFLGGGAVGGHAGGMMAAAGIDVALIDAWPGHVEAIRANGLRVLTPEGETLARPEAWHLGDAYRLRKFQPDVAFLTVKLYDTAWAAALLAQWLPAGVPVVTLQNCLVEELVAGAVGWGRVLGCIGSGLDVWLVGPGEVKRSRKRGASGAPVYKVGEMHGRVTERAERIAALLGKVDSAVVTTDLWTQRWEKLCQNVMTSGLSALTGLALRDVYSRENMQAVAVSLGAEALVLGEAMGFYVPKLFGLPATRWREAGAGDSSAVADARAALGAQAASMVPGGISGSAQDLQKGRPTEVDFLNGYVARMGATHRVPVPVNAAVAELVRKAERGERIAGEQALARIPLTRGS